MSMLRVVSNSAMVQREATERQAQRDAVLSLQPSYVDDLGRLVLRRFREARDAKRSSGVYDRLIKCLYQRRGEYTAQETALIRAAGGGSEVYSKITATKVRMLSAWIRDTYLSSDRPFTAKPSPVPDVPHLVDQDIQQELAERLDMLRQQGIEPTFQQIRQAYIEKKQEILTEARKLARETSARMEDKLHDVMLSGGWYEAMDACIDDLCTFPVMVMKGPTIRRRRQMNWAPTPQGGYEPTVEDVFGYAFARVSPFNFYPSPGAEDPNSCLYVCEEHKLLPGDLSSLLGVPGYNDTAIRDVLARMDDKGTVRMAAIETEMSSTRAHLEDKSSIVDISPEGVTAVEMWGSVPGKALLAYGMSPEEIPDPDLDYEVNVWLIADRVIKAVLNPDPLKRRPYSVVQFEPVPGSIWGLALSELISDMQSGANGALRALYNNMAMASGPQVMVDIGRMREGEPVPAIRPWQRWTVDSNMGMGGATTPPVNFFQPSSNAQELIFVYNALSSIADEISGLPKYMAGDNRVGGAGRTSSGLSMLMSSASKSIKQLIWRIDTKGFNPQLERLYYYLMKYDEDDSIKGDMEVQARGASVVAQEETQRMRLLEFLQITANPVDQSIVGPEVRADMLREVARKMGLAAEDRIPTGDQMKAQMQEQQQMQMQMQQMQQMQGGMPGQGGGQGGMPTQMQEGQVFPPGPR